MPGDGFKIMMLLAISIILATSAVTQAQIRSDLRNLNEKQDRAMQHEEIYRACYPLAKGNEKLATRCGMIQEKYNKEFICADKNVCWTEDK